MIVEVERSSVPTFDVVSTLVGIYSSEGGFIKEYQNLLAERLLSKPDYNCEREYRVFELLKRRYGEMPLHKCEVMLNDVTQSKLLNETIWEKLENILKDDAKIVALGWVPPISATIVSHLFWPDQKEPQIKLPVEIQHAFDAYARLYHNRKKPRKLLWRSGAGIVDLAIKIGNTTVNFKVSPTLATIVYQFNSKEQIREEDLASEIGLDVPSLKARIAFWINNGVLEESIKDGEVWYQRQMTSERTAAPVVDDSDDEMLDQRVSADSDSMKFECFKTYILEFLRHRPEGAGLDDIHHHLEKFVKQHHFDMSKAELEEYLMSLKRERDIEIVNGAYRIRNNEG